MACTFRMCGIIMCTWSLTETIKNPELIHLYSFGLHLSD